MCGCCCGSGVLRSRATYTGASPQTRPALALRAGGRAPDAEGLVRMQDPQCITYIDVFAGFSVDARIE
jgi:hypothetical protein